MSQNFFDDPEDYAEPADQRQVSRALGRKSAYHGRLYQLNTRLPEAIVEQVRRWADEMGMSQQDLQRYFFLSGLERLENGERPPVQEVVTRRLAMDDE